MKKVALVIIVLVIIAIAALFLLQSKEKTMQQPAQIEVPLPTPQAQPEESVIRYPVPEAISEETVEVPEPLPPLEQSDTTIQKRADALMGADWLARWVRLDDIARRFVVTIDNMTRSKLPQKYALGKSPDNSFLVKGNGNETYHIDLANYERYNNFINLFTAVETSKLVKTYSYFYPLFQEVYSGLGYPDAYFNDRLIEVIDHLLAMPNVEQPVKLVRPKVYYQFADARLEALSAGQKLLIRMGPENATKLKTKLQELRKQLAQKPG